ncbi:MAG: hypothetical protein GYB32_09500 [Algicola sp.]|nr:hypothetical protein [Algicola sp.]
MKNILVLIIIGMIGQACTNASEDDLIDATPLPTSITYEAHVKPIIDNNCISCHNDPPVNGAPMALTAYEDVKNAIETRGLIERISSEDQSFLMPFGGPRLPQNLIDLVVQWEMDGLLNN